MKNRQFCDLSGRIDGNVDHHVALDTMGKGRQVGRRAGGVGREGYLDRTRAKESDPLLESGTADAGEETLGEGAASVTVRCGNGGGWTAAPACGDQKVGWP